MADFYQKHKPVIHRILILLMVILGGYLFFQYVFSYIAPFVVAWILSSLIEPMVRWFHKKLKFSRGISSMLSIIIMLVFIGTIVTGIFMRFSEQAQEFAKALPSYYDSFAYTIDNLRWKTESLFFGLPINIQSLLMDNVDEMIRGFSNKLAPGVGKGSISFVAALPNALFFTIVTLISTFFMSKDREKIRAFIERQMPKSWVIKMDIIRRDLFGALLGYVKTQLILMIFTSTICMIGLMILRFEYAFLIGIIIGIVDAFPVLGSGTILIPWAAYHSLTGDLYGAIGLLIIYGVVVLFRQTFEPKVLGSQIGVYPLFTLMAMYIGIKLFGFLGIIIGPIFVIFLKTMQKIGILPKWK
ncbi:sporulation integral membrane protein YtvI [Defluviitalea saccharophila]|uniref:Sporulation integral membrane protein YtvI n=1 Tax=Defluviitalea saccharophila TaxID=879970 RepID=A0ABZ2Y5C2_9FIRM